MKNDGRKKAEAPRKVAAAAARCQLCGRPYPAAPSLPPPPLADGLEPYCEMLKTVIAERLKASPHSPYRLAKLLKLGRQTIHDWMKGRYLPSHSALLMMCRLWGCSMAQFVAEVEQRCHGAGI